MMKKRDILAVSFITMLAVSTANATVVTQTNVVGTGGVSVSVPASGQTNAGKLVVDGSGFVSKTGNATSKAVITNSSGTITYGTISSGMIASNAVTSAKIKDGEIVDADVSSSAAITTNKMGAITGYEKATTNANLATTDTLNTALGKLEKKADDAAAAAAAAASTASSHTHATSDVTTLGGYSKGTSSAALATSDTLNAALGKLENQIDKKVTANSAITAKSGNNLVSYDAKGLVTGSVAAGSLATKNAVASGDITDGTIVNADVSGSAAITTNKMGAITGYEKASTNAALATTDTLNTALGKLEKKADDAAAAAASAASTASSHTHASQDVTAMTGYTKASTAAAIAATDSLNTAIGKLEKTVDGKVTANSAITASGTTNKIVQYDSKGLVVAGTTAGSLATKNAVASADITDGTIVNADISSSAAIDQSKISGLSTSLSGKVDKAQGTDNKDKVMITNASGNVTTTKFVHTSANNGSNVYSATATDKDTTIPSVELVEDIAARAAGEYVAKDQTSSNANKAMITNASGQVVPVSITNSGSGFVTGVSISNGAVTVSKGSVGAANVASGLVEGTAPITVSRNSTSGVYTVAATAGSVASGNTGLVNGGTVYTEVRPAQTNGTGGTGYLGAPASTTTATNLTNLDTALKAIHPNTGQVKIPSGSETSSTMASIWVE